MSTELLVAVIAATLSLASLCVAIASWMTTVRRTDELWDRCETTIKTCKSLERRLATLERAEEPARPAAAGGSAASGRSMQEAGDAGFAQARPAERFADALPRPPAPIARDADRPVLPPPPPSMEQFLDEAAGALASVAAFNAFAARFPGQGYAIEDGSPSTLPPGATPDRADLHVLTYVDGRLVLPGFNLRRAQGLLTSDEGRAAEARLGWLFEIEQGQDMRASRGAVVELDGWTVRRKGRLTVPL